MNFNSLRKEPTFVAAAGGFLGLLLRALLYRIGFDEKGILSSTHPLHLAGLVLAGAMILFLALEARKLPEHTEDLPRLRFLLGLAAGCFLLIQALALYRRTPVSPNLLASALSLIRCILTALTGIVMVVCSFPAKKSRNISALCHGAVCMVFVADMLGRYQVWSGNPQLPDYVFHALAGVALSLCAYQTLALHTGLGKPKAHRFWCLAALFLCVMCLSGPEPRAFYLSGACWAYCCLLAPLPPETEAADEETADVPA